MGRNERVSAEVLAARALQALRDTARVIVAGGGHVALPQFQRAEREAAEGLRLLETTKRDDGK